MKEGIIRENHKKLYANKLDNLDEMDKFMNKLTKQIQEETEILNRPMIRDWISIKQSSYKEKTRSTWLHQWSLLNI